MIPVDVHAKDGGPGEVWVLCNFTMILCGLTYVLLSYEANIHKLAPNSLANYLSFDL